jgi:hypothetical protein
MLDRTNVIVRRMLEWWSCAKWPPVIWCECVGMARTCAQNANIATFDSAFAGAAPTGMSIGGVHGKWGQTARHRPATVTCENGPWKALAAYACMLNPPRSCNPCTRARNACMLGLHANFITRAQRSLPSRAMAKVAKRLGAHTAQDCDRNTFMITREARAGRASPTHTSTRLWGIPCVHCMPLVQHVPVSLGQSVIFLMKSAARSVSQLFS